MAEKKTDEKPAKQPDGPTPAQEREAEVYAERLKAAGNK